MWFLFLEKSSSTRGGYIGIPYGQIAKIQENELTHNGVESTRCQNELPIMES